MESRVTTILSALVLFASYNAFALGEAEKADCSAIELAQLNIAESNDQSARSKLDGEDAPVVLVQSMNMNPNFNYYNSQRGVAPDNTGWSPCTRKQFSLVEVSGWTPVPKGWRNPQYKFRKPPNSDIWQCKKI
jgi:hypothetical protein